MVLSLVLQHDQAGPIERPPGPLQLSWIAVSYYPRGAILNGTLAMFSPAPPKRLVSKISEVYLDESSQTKHRYLVMGCIIATPQSILNFEAAIRKAQLPELPTGEMKWVKVSRGKYSAYERVVDAFFDMSKGADGPHFHSLAVDTHLLDHKRFNEGSREIGFNKEVYQLLMKLGRLYRDTLFHVYPDRRVTGSNPDELRLILNRGIQKRSDGRDWPYRRVHWRDSEKSLSIQVVDLLIGGIAYRLNGHDREIDASPAKLALSERIIARSPITDVFRDTSVSGKFTLWHRQLRR